LLGCMEGGDGTLSVNYKKHLWGNEWLFADTGFFIVPTLQRCEYMKTLKRWNDASYAWMEKTL
jgi:hypothetical protein